MSRGRLARGMLTGILATVTIVATRSVAATNLVADGGFETPDAGTQYRTFGANSTIGPWTVASGTVDLLGSPRWTSANGKQSLDLNGGGPGSIFQAVSTTPGAAYTLRFAFAGNPESGPSVKTLSVRWGSTEIARPTFDTHGHTNQSMGWTHRSYTVHATASTTRLEFASVNTPGVYGPAIDDVTLTGAAGEPPAPVAGKSVVASVVSGTVFIKVPGGKRIRRGSGKSSAVAAATHFKRFRGRANIPIGSMLDTRKGRIAITSAADLKGATQSADFYDGIFQIKQARASHPITDADLVTSMSRCGKGARSSGIRRLGRLWATGKGKFRTRGRYSAASVRGTTWLTEERCDGTFTKVSRGTVSVLDRVKRKTIILTAGQSYFARAQRASSR